MSYNRATMKNTKIIWGIILVVVVVGALIYSSKKIPGKYDTFAVCLKDKGTTFYGAFWCPHCQNQKKMFGNSAKLLPYVECSTPNGQDMLPVCRDKGVQSYPTWVFADDSRLSGEISLKTLSDKTSCPLP